MIILAEDNPELPISKALSEWLNIEFIEGGAGFIKKLKEIGNKDAIVLIDNPIGVPKLKLLYESIVSYVSENCTNVYVTPIICAEHLALMSIPQEYFKPKYSWLPELGKHLRDMHMITPYPPKKIGYSGAFNS